jgi:membrane protease YdiL (CAAX protease family)
VARGWQRAILYVIAAAAGLLVLSVGSIIVLVLSGFDLSRFTEMTAQPELYLVDPVGIALQLSTGLGAIVLTILFRRFVDRRTVKSLGLSLAAEYRRDFAVGLCLGTGLIFLLFVGLLLAGQFSIVEVKPPGWEVLTVALVMSIVVFQEELIFRGYLLTNLRQSAGPWASLILVSMLFAAVHSTNPNGSWISMLNILLAGVLLGVYYLHRGNLWLPVGLHFSWNVVQGCVVGVPVSGIALPSIITLDIHGNDMLTGGEFGFEGSLIGTGVLIAAIVGLHLYYRRPAAHRQDQVSSANLTAAPESGDTA